MVWLLSSGCVTKISQVYVYGFDGTDQYDPDLMSALQEIKQLKRQLKVAEEEREILKKATAYFAKHS